MEHQLHKQSSQQVIKKKSKESKKKKMVKRTEDIDEIENKGKKMKPTVYSSCD